MKQFKDYAPTGPAWITVLDTEFYPDTLDEARVRYSPILERFMELAAVADNTADLLRSIRQERLPLRTQLQRVFRKYASPNTPVEMLKKITQTEEIIANFGEHFRPIIEVRANLAKRPHPDEAIMAILNEYSDRGQKGYDLTDAFFNWFEAEMHDFTIEGPRGAGRDISLSDILDGYEARTPVDFVIRNNARDVVAIGFARYDSDRGGAQEDDRTSGNRDKITELLKYNSEHTTDLKIIFLNDGPGLLLGSMWRDYGELEDLSSRVMVLTLKMLDQRLTPDWLTS